jgi:predicted dehydrogenase
VPFGIIGVGMQGSPLLATAVDLPITRCIAAADLYDGRHQLAREIAGPNIATTRRYQDLLDNKEIQAVIVAVPDHWHKQVVVDALSAGKHVYCEKPMSHTFAEGVQMAAAAKRAGKVVQIGSQRVSSPTFAKAKELFDKGSIGELINVELHLGRNDPTGAWEYPPPPDLSPSNLDWNTWLGTAPKKPFDPLAFARWRCWREYGTGVAGDLMVHLISGMQFITGINQVPNRAYATGGIVRWNDGRNMPDLHLALFEYGKIPAFVRLTLGTETPEITRIMGSHGIIEVSGPSVTLMPQSGEDTGPSYYAMNSFPKAMREEYARKWHAEHDPKPGQPGRMLENVTYRGIDYDDLRPHMWNFFDAIRSGRQVVEDATFGHHAAAACHMANESYFRKGPVVYDSASDSIKS